MNKSYRYSNEVKAIKVGTSSDINNRYSNKDAMVYPDGDLGRVIKLNEIKAEPNPLDKFIDVPIHYQYDPWRVAYDNYGDETLYWVILGANDLFDFMDLEVGMNIRIPTMTSIHGVGGLMNIGDQS